MGFNTAKVKLNEYPHNETLLHYMAVQMARQLMMSGISSTILAA